MRRLLLLLSLLLLPERVFAISCVYNSGTATASNVAVPTVLPATNNNDVVFTSVNLGSNGATINTPADYNQISTTLSGGDYSTLAAFWHHWLTGDPTSISVTWSGGNIPTPDQDWITASCSGVNTTTPIDGTPSTFTTNLIAGGTYDLPSIILANAGELLVNLNGLYDSGTLPTISYTSPLVERANAHPNNYVQETWADATVAGAGATGIKSLTGLTDNGAASAMMFALIPAVAGQRGWAIIQ